MGEIITSKIEQMEKNLVKVTMEIEAEKFEEGLKFAFNKYKKKFKINGFRPGTAPRQIVEKMYGIEVLYDDAIDHLMGPAYAEAITEHKLEPVARPDIDVVQIGKGQSLILTALVTTRPEVTLGDYKGIKIAKADTKVTEKDIEAVIKTDAEKNARIISVSDRKSKDGDILNIDFEGSVDGVVFAGGTAKGHELELGSKTFIDTFEDQLIGKEVGEDVVVKVTFPENYGREELNGKVAEFKVKVNGITEKVLPEINDELAQDISEFDTLADYKKDIKAKLTVKKAEEAKMKKQNEVVETVVKNATVEIPEVMIQNHVNTLLNRFAQNLQMQGMSINDFIKYTGGSIDELKKHYREDAEREIKVSLVIDAVRAAEKITADASDVDKEIEILSAKLNKPAAEVKSLLGARIMEIEDEIVFNKTIEFLENNSVEK